MLEPLLPINPLSQALPVLAIFTANRKSKQEVPIGKAG
jgi:hypothetical protein